MRHERYKLIKIWRNNFETQMRFKDLNEDKAEADFSVKMPSVKQVEIINMKMGRAVYAAYSRKAE